MNKIKINLGSGGRKRKGFINVDIDATTKPDVVHDLNKYPYPFKSNSASLIILSHVLEHLNQPEKSLSECLRIADNVVIDIPAPKSPQYNIPVHNFMYEVHALAGRSKNFPYWLQRIIGFFYPTEYKIKISKNYILWKE